MPPAAAGPPRRRWVQRIEPGVRAPGGTRAAALRPVPPTGRGPGRSCGRRRRTPPRRVPRPTPTPPRLSGRPRSPSRNGTPSNLSSRFCAKRTAREAWSAPRTFTENSSLTSMHPWVFEDRSTHTRTIGGSSDTDVNAFTVRPHTPDGTWRVPTTVTPVGYRDSTPRRWSGSTAHRGEFTDGCGYNGGTPNSAPGPCAADPERTSPRAARRTRAAGPGPARPRRSQDDPVDHALELRQLSAGLVGVPATARWSTSGIAISPIAARSPFTNAFRRVPTRSSRPCMAGTPNRDYAARQRVLDQRLFGKVLLLSLSHSVPLPILYATPRLFCA